MPDPNRHEKLYAWLDDNYLVRCRFCNAKIIEPEKSKNQVYLQGICPTCRNHSSNWKRWNKEQKKLQKLAEKQRKRGNTPSPSSSLPCPDIYEDTVRI
jgi:phage FluMu protein Com